MCLEKSSALIAECWRNCPLRMTPQLVLRRYSELQRSNLALKNTTKKPQKYLPGSLKSFTILYTIKWSPQTQNNPFGRGWRALEEWNVVFAPCSSAAAALWEHKVKNRRNRGGLGVQRGAEGLEGWQPCPSTGGMPAAPALCPLPWAGLRTGNNDQLSSLPHGGVGAAGDFQEFY